MHRDPRFLRSLFATAALTLVLSPLAWAQAPPPAASAPASGTGKISGKLTEKGKDPIPYANVIVLGTKQGAQSDDNGNFVIGAVPVGTWQVKAQAIGYEAKVLTVKVDAGQTTTANFDFGESKVVKTIEEIEVRAEKRIDTKSSTTRQSISAQNLKDLPVDNIMGAIGVKAGVVATGGELHVRGGRAGEVKFQFDGVEVNDPLFGGGANIANLAVAGTELISGGLDAEYGNALSGVVSVSTKEGTEKFGGEVRWDTDRYGDPTKTYDNYDRFTFGFGGPTPLRNLTYFGAFEGTYQDTYLKLGMTQPRRTILDFINVGFRQNNNVNTNLKLAYRANPKNKMTMEFINNRTVDTPYNHMWSRKGFVKVEYDTVHHAGLPDTYRPRYGSWSATQQDSSYIPMNLADHLPSTDGYFRQLTFVWTAQLSALSVLNTRISRLGFDTEQTVGGKQPWEYDTQSPDYWSGNTVPGSENNYFFATHGDFPFYSSSHSVTYTVKSDFSTRHWKGHTVKFGAELDYNSINKVLLNLPNSETNGLPGGQRSAFVNFNPEGSGFLQDRWEFEGLVLNAGLRYDIFSPGLQIASTDLPNGRYKKQWSPRLGIAYPISDKDVLSFHYGWTFQTPPRNFIFENRGISTSVAVRGNPDLQPETNISYQAAVQHLFSRDVSGQFTVFFRDIYGLLTVRQEPLPDGTLVPVYRNGDYASARGFEASMVKSFSHKFSMEANYTFSVATGVASNPNEALQFINGGRLYLPIAEQPLDWDQRHTFSLQAVLRDPGKWGFNILWTYGSGLPFTPTFENDRRPDPALSNSRRLPPLSTLALVGDKFFKVWGQNFTLFFDARNLLDAQNISSLDQNTFPNPNVNRDGQSDYLKYYTETGRAGGAYLQDINGDGKLDWVPVNDPRVFSEGRAIRVGASVAF